MKTLLLDLYYLAHFLAAECIGRLPSAGLRETGIDALAWVAGTLSIAKRNRIRRHVEMAFGSALDEGAKKAISRGCFREFWREMVDWVPGAIDGPLATEVPVRGLGHLQTALGHGRGVILWESNGFSRRVRAKQVLHGNGVDIYQTHGETHLGVMDTDPKPGTWIRTRLLRGTYERREKAWVAEIVDIPLNATVASGRTYLKHLRRNHVLCMAGDGQIARQLHPVRLLGRIVQLAPGAVKLARLSGAPLLPVFWVPSGEGAPALEIDPPIVPQGEDDASIVACLQKFATALESRVRRWPASYRNWHLLGDQAQDGTAARAMESA